MYSSEESSMQKCDFLNFKYNHLIRFAHQKVSFQLPELYSIAEFYQVHNDLAIPENTSFLDNVKFKRHSHVFL